MYSSHLKGEFWLSVLFEVDICLQRGIEVMSGEEVGRAGVLCFTGYPGELGGLREHLDTFCDFGVWGSSKNRGRKCNILLRCFFHLNPQLCKSRRRVS